MAVKKNIIVVFVLMLVCVTGITVLQFYYSYINYKTERAVFERDVNEALVEAADTIVAQHRADVVQRFKGWMHDTTFVKISCQWNEKSSSSVFTITDADSPKDERGVSISLSIPAFENIRIDTLTPKQRDIFINHMGEIVRGNLNKGEIMYYTQKIGQRLSDVYYTENVSDVTIEKEYGRALQRRGIDALFVVQGTPFKDADFKTREISISYSDARKHWVRGYFMDSALYMLGQMKWVLAGSLALLFITLGCFAYTARVLLSQHKLNTLKDAFISNMTHELHTPLASLSVTAEALKRFSLSEEERQAYVDIIYAQSHKLIALSDEILTGARLERMGILRDESVSVNSLIKELEDDVQYAGIMFEPAHTDVAIRGNTVHLLRALRNLLDNALKYNNAGLPAISLKAKTDNKQLYLSVSDNGLGIPDAYKRRVFDAFYRIPTGNVHDVKGYGLGLGYVKKVVEAHGGGVSVKDNHPAGCIFEIILPYETA